MADLLCNDKITLRAMEPADIDLIYEWENATELWTVSDTVAPYSREALMLYIANCANDIYTNKQLRLMISLNATGETIGTMDFLNFNPIHNRAELGIFICKKYQGQGLSAETMKIVNNYAACGLGLRSLYAYIPEDNAASIAMIRRAGFEEVGILQSWIKTGRDYHNVVLLQKIY
ncbi:MAG: GNAT family N-acetyltransferase [Muribaculaceae bacterium]|nr:GNAT family N-acetyltransferase [Muribaculaceae bacterium]